jgi:hypothetical protein
MKKIIGIFVMMLLIGTSVLPVLGMVNKESENILIKANISNDPVEVPVWEIGDSWTYNEKYCTIGYNFAWYHNCTIVSTVTDVTENSYILEWVSENDEGSFTIDGYCRLKFTPFTKFNQETQVRKTDLAHERTSWEEKGPVLWLISNLNIPIPAYYSNIFEETYTPADKILPFPITAGDTGTFPAYSYSGYQKSGIYWGIIKIVDSGYSGNILERDYSCEMSSITVTAGNYDSYNISIEGNFNGDNEEYHSTIWTYYVPEIGYIAKQYVHTEFDSSGDYYHEYTADLVSTNYTP